MLKRLAFISILIIATWTVAGGGRLQDPSALQQRAEVKLPLLTGNPIQQSFIPQRDNLTAIGVRINEQVNSEGRAIRYHLIQRGPSEHEVASGTSLRGYGEDEGYYFLRFPAQYSSRGAEYVVRLDRADSQTTHISVWASAYDEYENGQASQGSHVFQGDLTFKLYYEYTPIDLIVDLANALPGGALVLLTAVALFILPGLALLSVLPSDSSATLVDILALGFGVSIALMPILLNVVTLAGLYISPFALWMGLVACALIVCIRVFFSVRRSTRLPDLSSWDWAMLGLLLASMAISLIAIREMRFPQLLDSGHHTLITQLIIEKGQIPDNYRPYYPFDQFTYHFGFHTIAAFLSELTGLPSHQGVILAGQLITALTGLTLYMATAQFAKSRRIAFFAAATILLLNHIPAFYVNWGRYTQLTGQALLPVFALATVQMFRQEQLLSRRILLTIILSAGMFFIHYRVALFGAMFILAWLSQTQSFNGWPRDLARAMRSAVSFLKKAGLVAAGTLLLTGTWLWNISQNFLIDLFLPSAERGKTVIEEAASAGDYFGFHVEWITLYGATLFVLALAVIGLLVALWRHNAFARAMLVWMVLMFGGAYLYLINPRLGLYSFTIAIIAVYLPAGMLAGFAWDAIWIGWTFLWQRMGSFSIWRPLGDWVRLAGLVIALTFFGMQRMGEVRLDNGFVRPADEQAIDWIRSNTPMSAKFMVAASFWQPVIVGGQDAGSWLPLLAHRETTLPAFLYPNEGPPALAAYTNRLARELDDLNHPDQALGILEQNGIQYIYMGNRPSDLKPSKLNGAKGYQPVYHHDGVWIFQVR